MSQENVEIVREAVRAWNDRDLDRMLELSAGEVEWAPANPGAVDGTVYRGRDEVPKSTHSYLSWQQGLEAAGLSEHA